MTLLDRAKAASVLGALLMLGIVAATALFGATDLLSIVFSPVFAVLFPVGAMLAAPAFARLVPVKNEQGREFGPVGLILMFIAVVAICIGLFVQVLSV